MPSIRAYLDDKNRNPDDKQAIIKHILNKKAKAIWQVLFLAQTSDACYFRSYKLPKHKEFKDGKNSEIIKNYFFATDSHNRIRGHSYQALGPSFKKDSYLYKVDQQSLFFNTPTTGSNVIVDNKDKKQSDKALNKVECYFCSKKKLLCP